MSQILQVGPSTISRGGIAALISLYMQYCAGAAFKVRHLSTTDDRSLARNLFAAIKACVVAPWAIASSDVVHVHTASRNSWRRKICFILLAKLLRRKLIIHIHGGGFGEFFGKMGSLRLRCNRWVLQLADRVVCLSPRKLADVRDYLQGTCTTILPNPCTYVPDEHRRTDESTVSIVFAGWIEREKGVFDLIRAMAMIGEGPVDVRLTVAGKGKIEECRELAQRLGVAARVDFPGWLDKGQLHQLYSAADVFCLPSYVEGVPMSVLEAMAFGLPVVACPVGGIPDIVTDGVHGVFVPPGDCKAIATALERLVASPSLRNMMGAACRREVIEKYSGKKIGARLVDLYNSLLSNSHAADCAEVG